MDWAALSSTDRVASIGSRAICSSTLSSCISREISLVTASLFAHTSRLALSLRKPSHAVEPTRNIAAATENTARAGMVRDSSPRAVRMSMGMQKSRATSITYTSRLTQVNSFILYISRFMAEFRVTLRMANQQNSSSPAEYSTAIASAGSLPILGRRRRNPYSAQTGSMSSRPTRSRPPSEWKRPSA